LGGNTLSSYNSYCGINQLSTIESILSSNVAYIVFIVILLFIICILSCCVWRLRKEKFTAHDLEGRKVDVPSL